MSKHLTGFDEEVALGQLGEILENDSVVMSVEFADEDRQATRPIGEPLWRGVTLIHYENGRWRRMHHFSLQTIVSMPFYNNKGPNHRQVIRQLIKLEPNDSTTLFGIRPVLESLATTRLNPFLNPVDGTIFRPESRGGYDYEVLSDVNPDAPQDGEMVPSEVAIRSLRDMPEALRARFREIAIPLVKNLTGEGIEAITARARAVESYLRDSREFSYTLEMGVVNRRLDPVEDFLVNRKKGHCEYFASGLALLLRSIDIPARLVNGFKGGDWNELTQSMNVRQKHAHSWVEAYVGLDEQNKPRWVTLDPTPGAERDESVAHVGGISGNVRSITDIIRYVWVFYILGYDSSRQNRLLYTPLKMTIQKVREGYATIWELVKKGFARLFDFQSLALVHQLQGLYCFVHRAVAPGAPGEARRLAGSASSSLVARSDRRLGGADRGDSLLSTAGPAPCPVRPRAHDRGDPERVRPSCVAVPHRAGSTDSARGRGPSEDRRRVLSGAVRTSGP